jgi:hypothetical protein
MNRLFNITTCGDIIDIDKFDVIINKIRDFIELNESDYNYIEKLHKSYLMTLLKIYNSNVKSMNEYISFSNN